MKTQRTGYKEFDWEIAKEQHNPIKLNYYKHYWDKKVSQEEYIETLQSVKQFTQRTSKKYKGYTPSNLKKCYNNLKREFGFFIGQSPELIDMSKIKV